MFLMKRGPYRPYETVRSIDAARQFAFRNDVMPKPLSEDTKEE